MGTPFADLPADARPRERMTAVGTAALHDTELLALILRSGARGVSANDLAARLLAHGGGLHGLRGMTVEELATTPGVGPAKAAGILAAFELGRRSVGDFGPDVRLARASDVAALAQRSLAGLRRERVLVFVCDRRGKLLREVVLTSGTTDRSLIDVRDLLNAVLRHDGAAFAVAHNHPSGDPTPSPADVEITTKMATAAKAVGLRFLGHVIVADQQWTAVAITPAQ